jgi:hypothetical protein
MEVAQACAGLFDPAVTGLLIERPRLHVVLGHAQSVLIEVTEIVATHHLPAVASLLKQRARLGKVLTHALAIVEKKT